MAWRGSLQKLHRPRCIYNVCFPCGILPCLQILYKQDRNSQLDSQETHRCSQYYLRLSELPLAGGILHPASLSGPSRGQPVSVHGAFCGLDLGGVCSDDLPSQSLEKHLQSKKGLKSKLCKVVYCKTHLFYNRLYIFDSIRNTNRANRQIILFPYFIG